MSNPIDDSSICLLIGSNPKSRVNGTGFVVVHDKEAKCTLLVTAAHVIENMQDEDSEQQVQVDQGQALFAKIITIGSSNDNDLALLSIPLNMEMKAIPISRQAEKGQPFHTNGYASFGSADYVARPIQGKLGERLIRQNTGITEKIGMWDLHVEGDALQQLKGGYSGSPLCNEQGQVIAVISHRVGGDKGHAVAMENLPLLKDVPEKLLKLLLPGQNNTLAARAEKVRTDLTKDMTLFMPLGEQAMLTMTFLTTVEKGDMTETDEEKLTLLEAYLDNRCSAQQVQDHFSGKTEPAYDYQNLAKQLFEGRVAICLGQNFPSLFECEAVPDTEQLPAWIQQTLNCKTEQPSSLSIAETCEQLEIQEPNRRHDLLTALESISAATGDGTKTDPYGFFSELPPTLFITASYDQMLANSFDRKGKKYILLSPDYRNIESSKLVSKLVYWDSAREASDTITPEELSTRQFLANHYSIIFSLRGFNKETVHKNLIYSECHYLICHQKTEELIPDYISNRLRENDFWFIGHGIENWEDRLIAQLLQKKRENQHQRIKTKVVGTIAAKSFTWKFWEQNNALCLNIAPAEFIEKLRSHRP